MSGLPGRIRDRPRLALAALLVALVVAAGVQALLTPDRQLSAYDEDDRGLSQARLTVEETGFPVGNTLTSPHLLEGLQEPGNYLYVVAGVEEEYTDSEVDAILDFVRDGGQLVLADDFGFGNDVATEIGVTFSKRVLRDDDFRGNQSFVEVNASVPGRQGNTTLLTNVPTGLNVGSAEGQVLARTSSNAYIDVNGNGMEDPSDISGPFPVAYRTSLGEGDVVLLSDPGILTNQALAADDVGNRDFFRGVAVALLPGGGTVVFDESRHAAPLGLGVPLGLASAAVTGTQDPLLGSIAFVAVVGSLALAALLLTPPGAFGIHKQVLDRLRTPSVSAERRGHRLRALAIDTVARAHDLRGPREEVAREAREVVDDPALRSLLEADDPSVSPGEGDALLDRIDAYQPGAEARREEVTA